MLGICLTCGHDSDDVEAHHVAGRANYPRLTVPVCGDCHRILTAWQRASGVGLDQDAARTELDRMRALAVGTFDLFRLAAQRHPHRSGVGAPLATLTGRAFSRLLDLGEPADRPGRWLPDPTQPPAEAPPVAALEQTQMDLVVLFATLAADFLTLVGDDRDHTVSTFLRGVAADADGFNRAWQALQHDQEWLGELLADLRTQRERCERLVAALLVADPDTELDAETLDQVRSCVLAGPCLTRELIALSEQPTRAVP